MRGRLAAVALRGPIEEDAAEELRVERLHTAAEDLGEAGEIRDVRDGEARGREVLRRAARRNESEAQPGESAREFDQAAAVGDGEEREAGVTHGRRRVLSRQGTARPRTERRGRRGAGGSASRRDCTGRPLQKIFRKVRLRTTPLWPRFRPATAVPASNRTSVDHGPGSSPERPAPLK